MPSQCFVFLKLNTDFFLVRSRSELVILCTKKASDKILCPLLSAQKVRRGPLDPILKDTPLSLSYGHSCDFPYCVSTIGGHRKYFSRHGPATTFVQHYRGCWLAQDLPSDCHNVRTNICIYIYIFGYRFACMYTSSCMCICTCMHVVYTHKQITTHVSEHNAYV